MLRETSNRSKLEKESIINANITYTHCFEVCELHNDFFTSVSSRNHECIPPTISEDEISYYQPYNQVNTLFEFSPIQTDEIESTILSSNENKSRICT